MSASAGPRRGPRRHPKCERRYLSVFVAPALLVLGAWSDKPALAAGTVLLLFPLARLVFGACGGEPPPELHPRACLLLDWLPHAYVLALVAALAVTAWNMRVDAPGWATGIEGMLSLWIVLLLATCVAHDLIHRPCPADRVVGHVLAGIAGYPVLGYEHLRHHRLPGNTGAAEWPKRSESVWQFGWRRLARIASETVGPRGLAWRGSPRSLTVRGLWVGIAASIVTLAVFAAVAGWIGAATYVAAALLVACGVQLVTYIQHWGLGDDYLADARGRELAWDDDCRFEGWLTLHLSMHQAHHFDAGQPYYRLQPAPGSPRLPAGYVLLMFAAFVPAVWRHTMQPALDYWLAHPEPSPSGGRRLMCSAAYRRV